MHCGNYQCQYEEAMVIVAFATAPHPNLGAQNQPNGPSATEFLPKMGIQILVLQTKATAIYFPNIHKDQEDLQRKEEKRL